MKVWQRQPTDWRAPGPKNRNLHVFAHAHRGAASVWAEIRSWPVSDLRATVAYRPEVDGRVSRMRTFSGAHEALTTHAARGSLNWPTTV